jgi:hypothetical protein
VITPFRPADDDARLKKLSFTLMNQDLLLSDEVRNYDYIWGLILDRLVPAKDDFYEVEPWRGVMVITEIVPGYKGRLYLWLWDGQIHRDENFTAELRGHLDTQMARFGIKRLEFDTPDPALSEWMKAFGFKVEGRQKYGFKWRDKMITNYLLRKIKEV